MQQCKIIFVIHKFRLEKFKYQEAGVKNLWESLNFLWDWEINCQKLSEDFDEKLYQFQWHIIVLCRVNMYMNSRKLKMQITSLSPPHPPYFKIPWDYTLNSKAEKGVENFKYRIRKTIYHCNAICAANDHKLLMYLINRKYTK